MHSIEKYYVNIQKRDYISKSFHYLAQSGHVSFFSSNYILTADSLKRSNKSLLLVASLSSIASPISTAVLDAVINFVNLELMATWDAYSLF